MAASDWIEHSLTAASVVVASVAFLYGAWQQRQLSRRAHTIEVLLSHDVHGDLAQLLDRVDERLSAGTQGDSLDEDLKRVLNFYEFICAAAYHKTLDRALLVDTQRGRILRLYHFSRATISDIREARKNPRILDKLEWFARRQLSYDKWIVSREGQATVGAKSPENIE